MTEPVVYGSLTEYQAAVQRLDWSNYYAASPFIDIVMEPYYESDVVVTFGEFMCPNEILTQKYNRDHFIDNWLPQIVQGQTVDPIRVRVWAPMDAAQLGGLLDFKARLEVWTKGIPTGYSGSYAGEGGYAIAVNPIVIYAIIAILGLTILGIVYHPLFQAIGNLAQDTGKAIVYVGEALGDIGKSISKNLLPFALIVGGALVLNTYFSSPKAKEVKR